MFSSVFLSVFSVSLCLLFGFSPPLAAQGAVKSGAFLVHVKEQYVGRETFQVSDVELKGEVTLNLGVKIAAKTRIGYKDGNLDFFEAEQNNAKVTADTTGNPIKFVGPAGTKEVNLPPGALVLESVFMHHYFELVRRYDVKAGGKQTFQALVPSLAQVFPVVVELTGKTETSFNSLPLTLLKFQAVAAGVVRIDIVTDEHKDLLLVDVPARTFTAVREGFEALRPKSEPPATNDKYEGVEVVVPSGDVKLAGTLTLPRDRKSKLPAVVLLTGNGPQDRDEDTPPLLNTHLYRLIADRLSSVGVAVLRCDDRGVARSTGDFEAATFEDFLADARAQVAFARSRPEIDPERVSVLGHSEGTYYAALVAATDRRIKSLMLLAGPSRPLDFVMVELLEHQAGLADLPAEQRSMARSLLEPTRQLVADVKAGKPSGVRNGRKFAQLGRIRWDFEYLRRHFVHDPLGTLRKVNCPVLILHGDRDVLVPKYHADVLAETLRKSGNRSCTVKVFPYLTHMFTPFPFNNPDPEAAKKADTVSDEFLAFLTDWCSPVTAGRRSIR